MSSLASNKQRKKSEKPILVIGDVILDIHHFGARVADSEGVRVGREGDTRFSWGGAGLLVRNFLALGQKVVFISLLGDDEWSAYEKEWTHRNLTKYLVRERGRRTTVKERFVIGGEKAFKWNTLDNHPLQKATERRIYALAEKYIPECRALVISDYRHGLLSAPLAHSLLALARKAKMPVFVDSQVSQRESNHRWYAGADVFCLNETEARCVENSFTGSDIAAGLRRIADTLESTHIVVKRGAEGSAALLAGELVFSPPHPVTAVDPCGAGDAFLAALASCGFPPDEKALRFANLWAGLSTTIVGAEPPRLKDLSSLDKYYSIVYSL